VSRQRAERLYKVRGAATYNKLLKVRAKSGEPGQSKRGWITFCPVCPIELAGGRQVGAIGINAQTKHATCHRGHRFEVRG
jgi:hypothetical protein